MLDYSSATNQLYSMLHYAFAFLLLMVWWPRLFFPKEDSDDALENRFGRFGKTVCLYIVIVYILVPLRLYEVIAVCLVLLLVSGRKFWMKGSSATRGETALGMSVWFYELTEIGFRLRTKWREMRGKLTMIRKDVKLRKGIRGNPIPMLVLFGVLAAGAYVRFYDAVHSASPALSDGVVTLAWMKYVNNRILFHDGIYPQGFHITLSMLSKFAAIDPLYILKYTGPWNGVLTSLGYYFTVSRLTANKAAGIVGAALFGLGGTFIFDSNWERQAATNSQEFAMVFAFPCLYFFLRYLEKGGKNRLWNAAAACAITGFVHQLILVYAGMGIAVAIVAIVLTQNPRPWKRIWITMAASVLAVVVSYAPIQFATWSGVRFNSSAAEFLLSTTDVVYPPLLWKDYLAFAAIAVVGMSSLTAWRDRNRMLVEWFTVGFGIATFLLYYWAPVATRSTTLASRTGLLWTMTICFLCAVACWSAWRWASRWRTGVVVQFVLACAVAFSLAYGFRMHPIETYKMQWESTARVYLKIASTHTPLTWTIFSTDQEYALVYGRGWIQYIGTLVSQYDPTGTPITRYGQNEYDPDVTKDMYVIQQKQVYELDESVGVREARLDDYEREKQENKDFVVWLSKYEEAHGKAPIYFEDEHIRVYYLERPEADDKKNRKIWGSPDS